MIKQRHIGFVMFGIYSALSARLAMFEPSARPQVLTPGEERWGTHQTDNSDPLGLIHGARYYIYGIGVVGLLIVVEDYFRERSRKSGAAGASPQPAKKECEGRHDV